MTEAIITLIVLIVAGVFGTFLKPTEEQLKPLSPPEGAAAAAVDHHDHDHHH